jgi:ATP-binding cassette subfamily F protein uup
MRRCKVTLFIFAQYFSFMISYLQATNVSRRIGDILLFENLNLCVNKDNKIAVIAVNGAGKSSLLDILTGKESPDKGLVSYKRDLRIAYLEQLPLLNESNSILDELFSSDTFLIKLIREYEESIVSGDETMVQHMIQKMDDNKAWDYEVIVRQVLFKLNLTGLESKINTLSGGQRKRVALAKVLVEDADLLVLDEPTNHLDLDMIEWLEDYFIKSKKTLLMVTHDRYFLDRVCNVIIELSGNEMVRYEGNYEYYLEKKQFREDAERANVEKARNLLKTELEWMRRMPKARTHKSKSRIGSFYDLKDKAIGRSEDKSININVNSARMGKKILELERISKSFGDKKVIVDFTYIFNRFEKIGLVGKNGTGKTTLLNIITGQLAPDSGKVETGETIVFGYYKQEGITFKEDMTVIDIARSVAEKVTVSDGSVLSVVQFLNYFLFPPNKHRTLVRKLSGGEKRRLYLLTVLMKNPNFLILDEPTNDLDILTLNVLEDYLANFRGCVIIVSHDRYFMDKVVDHVFEYKGDGLIKDFPGNYTQLREKQREAEQEETSNLTINPPKKTQVSGSNVRKEKKIVLTYIEKKEFEKLANDLKVLEIGKIQLEKDLSKSGLSTTEIVEKSERLANVNKIIDKMEMRWLELSEKG